MTWLTEKRYQERVYDAEGHLVHPTMPSRMHGTSTGYMSFGCKCPPCRSWWKAYRLESVERKRHNERILSLLQGGNNGGNIAEVAETKPVEKPKLKKLVQEPWPTISAVETAEKVRENLVLGSLTEHPPPPLTPQIRARITSVALLEEIKMAYYEPEWCAPADRKISEGKARERRAHGNMEIIVGEDEHAPVIWFRRREVAEGKSEVLTAAPKALPKAHGGRGGNTTPNDTKAIVAALKAAGCEVTVAGSGHIKATRNGQTVTLPSTPSEWRSILNTWAQLKRSGIMAS